MADPGVVLGFPYQQLNSESGSFRYAGMSPEEAIQQQRLNRRQQIANLLIQRGLGQPQGQMAGRFYVPPSPLQGVANLALLGAGVYGTNKLGEEERDLQEKSRQATAQAVKDYITGTSPRAETVGLYGPGKPVMQPTPPEVSEAFLRETPENAPLRSQWVDDFIERGPMNFKEGPMPTQTTMREATPEERYAALAQAMVAGSPQAREAVRFIEQMRQHQTERELQRQQAILLKNLEAQNAAALKGIPSADAQAELAIRQQLHQLPSGNTLAQIGSQQQLHQTPSGTALAQIESREKLHALPSGDTQANIVSREKLHTTPSANALVQAADQVAILGPDGRPIANEPAIEAKRKIAEAGAAKTQTLINTYTPASEEAQKEYIKEAAKTRTALQSAATTLDNIDKAKALIPSAKSFMGPGGESLLGAAKFFNNRLGFSINTEGVKSAEELRSRIFFNIMDNLKKMDAQPSQLQQQIMQESLGKLGTDPNALSNILDAYADVIRGKVATYNEDVGGAEKRGVKFPFDPYIKIPPPSRVGGPAVGTVQDGYRFKGGDPAKPESWEKVP